MNGKRVAAMVLLGLLGLSGPGISAAMLSEPKDPPPTVIPILLILASVAALVAAVGLARRDRWAVNVGLGSRVVALLVSLPGVFFASDAARKLGAAVPVVASAITIAVLLSMRKHHVDA